MLSLLPAKYEQEQLLLLLLLRLSWLNGSDVDELQRLLWALWEQLAATLRLMSHVG